MALIALGILAGCSSSGGEPETASAAPDATVADTATEAGATPAEATTAAPAQDAAPIDDQQGNAQDDAVSEASSILVERLTTESVVGPFAISMPSASDVLVEENPNWDIVTTTSQTGSTTTSGANGPTPLSRTTADQPGL